MMITEALAIARHHHKAGDLGRAERAYREILRESPDHVEALYLLGEAYHQLRRPGDAAGCFLRVVLLNPDHWEACNYLGVVLLAQGKGEEAVACYRRALRIRPNQAEALANLGEALMQQGKGEEALASLRRGLALQPNRAELHYALGKAYRNGGQAAEAAACLREAIRLRPDFPQAHGTLGLLLTDAGADEEALACFQESVRLQPRDAAAQSNLATALVEQGKQEEAIAHYREALRLDPDCISALGNVAIHNLFPLNEEQVGRINTLLAQPRLAPASASVLHFALANLRHRASADDSAFENFRQGNALRRRACQQAGTGFDAEAHRRMIDRLVQTFTPEFFQRARGLGLDTEVPLFIVGMPRSGTTLVEQVLSQHPQVFGAGELPDVARLAETLPSHLGAPEAYPGCLARLDGQSAQGLAERHLQRLARLGGAALRVSDKMPTNFLHLGLIATLFPGARVLHCRRDALDTCLSGYLQYFRGMNFTYDLADLGEYYRQYERLMAHWRAVLPLPLLDVSYEEMVASQEEVSRRIVAFCGLGWDERCLAFHESPRPVHTMSMLQVRRPIYASSVGRWKRYEKHLRPLREALAGPGPA